MNHPTTSGRSLQRVVAAVVFGALLPLAVHAKDDAAPIALDAGFKASEQAGKMFSVAEGKALKNVKKVAVPLFSVEFVTADAQRAETSGFAAAGRASTTLAYTLKGVDEADFQAITTALYERFLADLKGTGIEVVPFDQVAALPSYKKMAAGGVLTAATTSWWRSAASGAAFARRAGPRQRRTWWTTSFRACRCASGSSRCPSRCACYWPRSPSW